jgi:hypothetical protein
MTDTQKQWTWTQAEEIRLLKEQVRQLTQQAEANKEAQAKVDWLDKYGHDAFEVLSDLFDQDFPREGLDELKRILSQPSPVEAQECEHKSVNSGTHPEEGDIARCRDCGKEL